MTSPMLLISFSRLLSMEPKEKSPFKNKWLYCWLLPEFTSRATGFKRKLAKKNSKMVLPSLKTKAPSKTSLHAIFTPPTFFTSSVAFTTKNSKLSKSLMNGPSSSPQKNTKPNWNRWKLMPLKSQNSRPWLSRTWRPAWKSGKSKILISLKLCTC